MEIMIWECQSFPIIIVEGCHDRILSYMSLHEKDGYGVYRNIVSSYYTCHL